MIRQVYPDRWFAWTIAVIFIIFLVTWGAVERYSIELDAANDGVATAILTSTESQISSESESTRNIKPTFGIQRTLVVLVNSSYLVSHNLRLISKERARDAVFNRTNAFISENSYGKTSMKGRVVGPYFIDTNDPEIDNSKIFELAAKDVDLLKYDRVIVFSSVSSRSTVGKQKFTTPDGEAYFSIMYNDYTDDVGYPLSHEFGHSLGMMHTGFLRCDMRNTRANDCQISSEAAGPFDPMGVGTGHYTAAYKDLIGWFSPQQAIIAKNNGIYRLEPLETNSNGPKTIKVPLGDNLYYYLEYRQPYDGVLLYVSPKHISGWGGGSEVHLFNPRGQTELELITTHTLKVGETFTDSNGIKISVVKANSVRASVSVRFLKQ